MRSLCCLWIHLFMYPTVIFYAYNIILLSVRLCPSPKFLRFLCCSCRIRERRRLILTGTSYLPYILHSKFPRHFLSFSILFLLYCTLLLLYFYFCHSLILFSIFFWFRCGVTQPLKTNFRTLYWNSHPKITERFGWSCNTSDFCPWGDRLETCRNNE